MKTIEDTNWSFRFKPIKTIILKCAIKKCNKLQLAYFFSDNIKVTFNIICDKVKKNGEEYINVKDLELTLDPESINFEYENVVDNEEISNQIRKVLNENSKIIFDDVKKDYETSYGLVFQDYAKRIFDKIPIKGIFLL